MASAYMYSPSSRFSSQPYGGYSNGDLPSSRPSPYQNGSAGAGFAFKKRFERVDWRKIAGIDIDRISRDLDFNSLQENIMNITFCNIEAEVDVRMIDPNFIKLFRLAQLTIEYLLHSQDYLYGSVTELEEKLKKAIEEHDETKRLLEKQNQELSEVKKESHKRKKMLAAQQQIIHAGSESYHKCPHCPKAFLNTSYLHAHINRRHRNAMTENQFPASGNQLPVQQTSPGLSSLLEKQLNDFQERLRVTESQLQEERSTRNERADKDQAEYKKRIEEMERLRQDEENKHKEQLDKMQASFMQELKLMSEELHTAKQAAMQTGHVSHLGTLHDEDELEELKHQIQEKEVQVQESQKKEAQVQKEKADLEKQYKDKMRQLKGQLKDLETDLQDERKTKGADLSHYEEKIKDLRQKNRDKDEQLREKERQLKQKEKDLKTQEREIKQLSSRPPPVVPRTEERVQRSPSPQKKTIAVPKIVEQPPTEEEDEEEEEETEEEEKEEEEESSTEMEIQELASTSKSNTLGSTSGDLTLTTKSVRLLQELKKNPTILQGLRDELSHVVDQQLQNRGIAPNAKGISNPVFKNKMALMKTERQQKAKKLDNFFDIRQQYINQVDEMAKERIKEQKKSQKSGGGRSTPIMKPRLQQSPARPHQSPARPQQFSTPKTTGVPTQSKKHSPALKHKAEVAKPQPKPAPRTPSPMKPSTGTLSSTGSGAASSHWDSDEISVDEDEDEEEESEGEQPPPKTAKREQPVEPPPVPPRENGTDNGPEEDEGDSEWDSEDLSELNEISPSKVSNGLKRTSGVGSESKGGMVASLARSIELQLSGRKKKKPAGGVDTIQQPTTARSPETPEIKMLGSDGEGVGSEEEEDSFSVSSLMDSSPENQPSKRPSKKLQDTDNSTNTYGTSVWGSSSKAVSSPAKSSGGSTIPRTVSEGSFTSITAASTVGTGKSSIVSVTDWDSDDDLDDI